MFTQSLLNTPLELNVLPHRVLSEARTTICISLATAFQARAGVDDISPDIKAQSLLNAPFELKLDVHKVLSAALTTI
jgi:hypothetical protein